MLESNFKQFISYISKTRSTCLDLIFTNFSQNLTTTVQDFGFSDHKCTILKLHNVPAEGQKFWYSTKRIYNDKCINKFKQQLQNI